MRRALLAGDTGRGHLPAPVFVPTFLAAPSATLGRFIRWRPACEIGSR
ncbi:hypothetical protein EDWATA_01648 [Edwardsiella tarda ATCC 23685]|uniref:Uncharacterized protein n=1 Tax=Edwardsiella tarda ATCC 23685 TaxID=500638 RepID=D4F4H7_EDWTA|nr:hypothetical protein EDWATA_01648 [Edwardsiella tarda ATCC 23685]